MIQCLYLRDCTLAFWVAAKAVGDSTFGVIYRYGVKSAWLPELADELAFVLIAVISIEGALSYLGLGVAEPSASFGNILASHFDGYLRGNFQVCFVVVAALLATSAVPVCLRSLLTSQPTSTSVLP